MKNNPLEYAWHTKYDGWILIVEMETKHLYNTIKMVEKKGPPTGIVAKQIQNMKIEVQNRIWKQINLEE